MHRHDILISSHYFIIIRTQQHRYIRAIEYRFRYIVKIQQHRNWHVLPCPCGYDCDKIKNDTLTIRLMNAFMFPYRRLSKKRLLINIGILWQ